MEDRTRDPRWVGAEAAAARVGVKVETLYAYASRGQLRRRRSADGTRSEYLTDDLDRLTVRGRRGRAARGATLAVRSAVTEIDVDHGPRFRGRLATDLAGHVTFEQVAARLWGTDDTGPWRASRGRLATVARALALLPDELSPVDRLPTIVAVAAATDPRRDDHDPARTVTAVRALLATAATLAPDPTATVPTGHATIAARLAGRLAPRRPGARRLIDAALVLLADHELAASTLAARTAASTRAGPYDIVQAGLATVRGPRHGTASRPVEAALARLRDGATAATTADDLVSATPGGSVPGFGHPLYPDGDPRAVRLLGLVADHAPRARAREVGALVAAVADRGVAPPNVDLALAAVTHALDAPVGTGALVFCLARTVGWTAHALEQYEDTALLRPRAVPR